MRKCIRILHMEITENIGGIEVFLKNIYKNINRDKVQFDFICRHKNAAFEKELKVMGSKIYHIPSYSNNPIKYYISLKKIITNNNYNIVHIHKNSAANILPFVICSKLKVKTVIAHSHNTASNYGIVTDMLHKINRSYMINNITDAFACSNIAGKWLFGEKYLMSNKVPIIHNGVDTNTIKFNKNVRYEVRHELGVQGKFVIGHIGRFVEQKNHHFLIDIFSQIYKENKDSILILIGNGPLEDEIKSKVKNLNLEHSVLFLGERYDVERLYQAMDIFLLPSLYEGLPVVGIEAQAAGVRCVFSNSITREVRITKEVDFIDINLPDKYWAERVLSYINTCNHKNTKNIIIKNGYDIKSVAKRLENFYIEKHKK